MQALQQRKIWFWVAVTALLLLFIYAVKSILLPFVIGIGVAYFLDPAADKLERWGCSRTAATSIICIGFFGLLTLGLILLAPALYEQLSGLIAALPDLVNDAQRLLDRELQRLRGRLDPQELAQAKDAVSGLSSDILKRASTMAAGALQSGFALVNLLSLILIAPVVSFYLLRDWDRLVAAIDALLPRDSAPIIREQMRKIDDTISGFVRGTVNVMLILGTFYAVTLSLVELNFAIIIGLLGGFLIIIPYLGTVVTGIAAVGMALLQFDGMQPVLIVLAIFIVGQVLEGNVLTPKLVGDKVGLHPLWLIFGMLAGATLFGFVGVFLAVPATAVIGVLMRFAIERYRHSDYYQKQA